MLRTVMPVDAGRLQIAVKTGAKCIFGRHAESTKQLAPMSQLQMADWRACRHD